MLRDTKFMRKSGLCFRRIAATNLRDLFRCEFRSMVFLTACVVSVGASQNRDRQVGPSLAAYNIAHELEVNPKLDGEIAPFLPRCVPVADFSHLCIGQSRQSVFLATGHRYATGTVPVTSCRPALPNHILHVVFVGAKEQMVGANAGPVVAMVANAHPCGDRAVDSLIGKAMDVMVPTVDVKNPVAVILHRSSPIPTMRFRVYADLRLEVQPVYKHDIPPAYSVPENMT